MVICVGGGVGDRLKAALSCVHAGGVGWIEANSSFFLILDL